MCLRNATFDLRCFSFRHDLAKSGKPKDLRTLIGMHLPFSIIIAIQILMAYFFWMAYGTLAFLLGFLRTWSIILALTLWYFVLHLPQKCVQEVTQVWGYKLDAKQTEINLATSSK